MSSTPKYNIEVERKPRKHPICPILGQTGTGAWFTCKESMCALWVTTYNTDGIMVETCGLVHPSYVKEV